ncbi:MAG TPA: TIGR04255 family protein [Oculatellaceae cyanobacterium]
MQSMKGFPSYNNPPVGEVSITVQFQKLATLRSLEMAEFRTLLTQFSRAEEHPLVPPTFEQFPGRIPVMQSIEIQLLDVPPPPRYIFITESNDELIQLQQDRFGYNWRKAQPSQDYPRYEKIVANFKKYLTLLSEFVKEKNLGQLVATQCDITYSNQLQQGEGWETFSDVNKILNLETIKYAPDFAHKPEAVEHTERHVIELDGKPVGRLYIQAEPAFDLRAAKPILRLTLVARGKPLGAGTDGVLKFIDLGRKWVVEAFAACTKPEIQKIWGKLDGANT